MRIIIFLITLVFLLASPAYAGYKTIEDYTKTVQKKVNRNWKPGKEFKVSKKIVAEFTITRAGNLKGLEIVSSSDIPKLDHTVIKAIQKTAPFKPLPYTYEKNEARIQFKFSYNNFKDLSKKDLIKPLKNDEKALIKGFSRGQKLLYRNYKKHVHERIKTNWTRPVNTRKKEVIVLFDVNPGGQIIESEVIKTSGSMLYDDRALRILEDTILRPVPETLNVEKLTFYILLK